MIFKDTFYIGYRDIDTNLKIKNSAILNIFEDIAGMHAAEAGEGLKDSNTTWLLTGYKVNILKQPEHGERVDVFTWGTEIKNITASREFEIRKPSGELLITGLSNWVHINLKTKKIEKVSKELIDAYKLEPSKTNFNELKLKKISDSQSYLYEKTYKIDWNWIDANNHMNNIYYLEVAEMAMPDEIRKNNSYSGFEVMYKKEVRHGDTVRCLYAESEDSYIVTIKNEDLSEVYAIVKLNKKNS